LTETASLALATLAFVGTHLLMSHPLRAALVRRLGERAFQLAYSLIAVATLGWMILAYGATEPSPPLWVAPQGWWYVALAIMLLASILLVGSFVRNPAFPHPGAAKQAARPAAGVFAITRHPMNWSFMLWALVHVSVWGSARNLIVAAGIFILALVGSLGQDRKKRSLLGDAWRDWQARTSFIPFGAVVAGRASWRAALPSTMSLLGGLVLWLLVTWYHAPAASVVAALIG
jgi:uncharacterized membrane protein